MKVSDIVCITVFLTSLFNKEWNWLDLSHCHIQDQGLNILYHGLCHTTDLTINTLWLLSNGLTAQSSSLISELTVRWKVKVLGIGENYNIGEDQQLYSMLSSPSSELEELQMWDTQLSSIAATDLFKSLRNKLKNLCISYNSITDDACEAIILALKSNSSLVKLLMTFNPLSNEAIASIVQCLEVNNTLQYISLPDCPQDIKENFKCMEEVINNKRANRGCQVKLEIR